MSASYIQPLPAMREYSQEDKLELYKWQTNQKAIYKKHAIINVENGENVFYNMPNFSQSGQSGTAHS